jgi:hypothetical protein
MALENDGRHEMQVIKKSFHWMIQILLGERAPTQGAGLRPTSKNSTNQWE